MGFRMPAASLRMARIHPGHNGPPPPSNVIPEPAQNRVRDVMLTILTGTVSPKRKQMIMIGRMKAYEQTLVMFNQASWFTKVT